MAGSRRGRNVEEVPARHAGHAAGGGTTQLPRQTNVTARPTAKVIAWLVSACLGRSAHKRAIEKAPTFFLQAMAPLAVRLLSRLPGSDVRLCWQPVVGRSATPVHVPGGVQLARLSPTSVITAQKGHQTPRRSLVLRRPMAYCRHTGLLCHISRPPRVKQR